MHESDAIEEISKILKVTVLPYRLSVNSNLPYLAAMSDGLIDKDSIIEMKCPSSWNTLTPKEDIKIRKIAFWKIN